MIKLVWQTEKKSQLLERCPVYPLNKKYDIRTDINNYRKITLPPVIYEYIKIRVYPNVYLIEQNENKNIILANNKAGFRPNRLCLLSKSFILNTFLVSKKYIQI